MQTCLTVKCTRIGLTEAKRTTPSGTTKKCISCAFINMFLHNTNCEGVLSNQLDPRVPQWDFQLDTTLYTVNSFKSTNSPWAQQQADGAGRYDKRF